MRFAHFSHVWMKDGFTPHERYEQLWRELALCDELGFDYGFCVEHHFTPRESWMSAPSLYAVAAGARTRRIRLGAMGYVVPLHHPIRLLEEIAIVDQILDGRLEVGLVPGIVESYFEPFEVDFKTRREVTLEFAHFLKEAYRQAPAPVTFAGRAVRIKDLAISVAPMQRPHPPLWMETRDAPTLEFCAREGLHTGYFLVFPRKVAKLRYAAYLDGWKDRGWPGTPNIAYLTLCYVDETDEKARSVALAEAGNAYRGFFSDSDDPGEIRDRQLQASEFFRARGEPEAAEIFLNLLDPDYLDQHDLILIGSPETVCRKLKAWAVEGSFNTFFGEFNFGAMPEQNLMNSLRLFGTCVIRQLRNFEPFRC